MSRYLDEAQLKTNLSLGTQVEQWVSSEKIDDYTILKWLIIHKEKEGTFSLVYMETFDEGDEDSVDIYEFSVLDPDEPYGVINSFDNIDDVLKFATSTYQADIYKYVGHGVLQEEYKDYLTAK